MKTKEIEVHLKKEDFETSNYFNGNDCALARGLKRKFPDSNIDVGGNFLFIDKHEFLFINNPDEILEGYEEPKNTIIKIEVPDVDFFN